MIPSDCGFWKEKEGCPGIKKDPDVRYVKLCPASCPINRLFMDMKLVRETAEWNRRELKILGELYDEVEKELAKE